MFWHSQGKIRSWVTGPNSLVAISTRAQCPVETQLKYGLYSVVDRPPRPWTTQIASEEPTFTKSVRMVFRANDDCSRAILFQVARERVERESKHHPRFRGHPRTEQRLMRAFLKGDLQKVT